MKRTTVIATAIAATLSLGGASVALAAQSPLGSAVCGRPYAGACQTLRNACSGWNFVDADGDGVCDNWNGQGAGVQRGQGRGLGQGQGQGQGHGNGNGNGGGWGRGNR